MANRVVWTFLAKDKFSGAAKSIARRTQVMKDKFKSLNATMKKTGKGIKKVGQSLTKMSIVSSAAVVGSLKAFGDMEQGLTNVFTLMSDEQIEEFGDRINKLSTGSLNKFGFNIEETNQALFDTVSALQVSTTTLDAFEASQKLAIGGASF